MIVIVPVDCTSTKQHFVFGQRTGLIRENMLHLRVHVHNSAKEENFSNLSINKTANGKRKCSSPDVGEMFF